MRNFLPALALLGGLTNNCGIPNEIPSSTDPIADAPSKDTAGLEETISFLTAPKLIKTKDDTRQEIASVATPTTIPDPKYIPPLGDDFDPNDLTTATPNPNSSIQTAQAHL